MAKHSDRYIAYRAAYPAASKATARTSAARLLSKPGIATRIQEARLQTGVGLQAAMRSHYENALVDIEEKRAFLAGVISGKSESQIVIKDNRKGTKTTVVKNSVRDILKAIALDARLEKEWNKIKGMRDLSHK